jgi:hypothetical protein
MIVMALSIFIVSVLILAWVFTGNPRPTPSRDEEVVTPRFIIVEVPVAVASPMPRQKVFLSASPLQLQPGGIERAKRLTAPPSNRRTIAVA